MAEKGCSDYEPRQKMVFWKSSSNQGDTQDMWKQSDSQDQLSLNDPKLTGAVNVCSQNERFQSTETTDLCRTGSKSMVMGRPEFSNQSKFTLMGPPDTSYQTYQTGSKLKLKRPPDSYHSMGGTQNRYPITPVPINPLPRKSFTSPSKKKFNFMNIQDKVQQKMAKHRLVKAEILKMSKDIKEKIKFGMSAMEEILQHHESIHDSQTDSGFDSQNDPEILEITAALERLKQKDDKISKTLEEYDARVNQTLHFKEILARKDEQVENLKQRIADEKKLHAERMALIREIKFPRENLDTQIETIDSNLVRLESRQLDKLAEMSSQISGHTQDLRHAKDELLQSLPIYAGFTGEIRKTHQLLQKQIEKYELSSKQVSESVNESVSESVSSLVQRLEERLVESLTHIIQSSLSVVGQTVSHDCVQDMEEAIQQHQSKLEDVVTTAMEETLSERLAALQCSSLQQSITEAMSQLRNQSQLMVEKLDTQDNWTKHMETLEHIDTIVKENSENEEQQNEQQKDDILNETRDKEEGSQYHQGLAGKENLSIYQSPSSEQDKSRTPCQNQMRKLAQFKLPVHPKLKTPVQVQGRKSNLSGNTNTSSGSKQQKKTFGISRRLKTPLYRREKFFTQPSNPAEMSEKSMDNGQGNPDLQSGIAVSSKHVMRPSSQSHQQPIHQTNKSCQQPIHQTNKYCQQPIRQSAEQTFEDFQNSDMDSHQYFVLQARNASQRSEPNQVEVPQQREIYNNEPFDSPESSAISVQTFLGMIKPRSKPQGQGQDCHDWLDEM